MMTNALAEQAEKFWQFPTNSAPKCTDERIALLGLGYVGLPLGIALAEAYQTVVGFDCDQSRVGGLRRGYDRTKEVEPFRLCTSSLEMSATQQSLTDATIYIVTVPTPVDSAKRPNLEPLLDACRLVARYLTPGSVVVFESTVYPGATEELCVPELARFSGLEPGLDFAVAYSPERINPGDTQRGLQGAVKIVSASDDETLDRIANMYEKVVSAGVYRAPSIQVAEAAKVFENTQRDVNIGLMNEFAQICDRLGLRTADVLSASGTKWNALPFRPGLVGGHCIGVDPYYLAHKSEEAGYTPDILRASRRVNESVAQLVAQKGIQHLNRSGRLPSKARVGIFGVSFKENVPDTRNSKVFDIIKELSAYGVNALVHDPVVGPQNPALEGINLVGDAEMTELDLLIFAVPHQEFSAKTQSPVLQRIKSGGMLIDVKSFFNPGSVPVDIQYWSL